MIRLRRLAFILAAVTAADRRRRDDRRARRGTTPAEIGQWSEPFAWPNVAVHTMLEPNGSVLSIDAWADAPNTQYMWNPSTSAFTLTPYARNLFCSGHTQIGGGKTLIVGGHVSANNGIKDTTIFDPSNNSWTRGPDMAAARWYPTATQLSDGRVFVFAGDDIDAAGPSVPHAFSELVDQLAPRGLQPDHELLAVLAERTDDVAALPLPLHPHGRTDRQRRSRHRHADDHSRDVDMEHGGDEFRSTDGSAVMYRPDKIMKSGSYTDPDFTGADLFQTSNADGGARHDQRLADLAKRPHQWPPAAATTS